MFMLQYDDLTGADPRFLRFSAPGHKLVSDPKLATKFKTSDNAQIFADIIAHRTPCVVTKV